MTKCLTVNETKEKSHIGFVFKILAFLALIFVKNVFKAPISETMLLFFSVLIIATSDRDEIVTFAICCIPMSSAFQYKYSILLCIAVYWLKYPKDIHIDGSIIPLALMMLWEALHSFGYYFSFNEYLRSFSALIFCTFLIISTHRKIDFQLVCRVFAIASVIMLSIVLFNLLENTNYNFEKIFAGTYRFGVGNRDAENFGVNYNANDLGFMCNLAVCGLLQLTILKQQKVIDYLMIIALLFFGLLSMSRSFLFCCAFVFIMYAVAKSDNMSGTVKAIISVIIILGILYYIVSTYAPFIVERITERFEEKDISSGRVDLMSFYNKHLFSDIKYLLFGIGLQNIPQKIYYIHGIYDNVPHNGIQELLVVWGIPGLCFFISYVYFIIKNSVKFANKHTLAAYIPLLLNLLKAQSGQLITSGLMILSFAFIYISLCVNYKEEKNDI